MKHILFTLVIFSISLLSCDNNTFILLHNAEKLVNQQPDSSLVLLNKIQPEEYQQLSDKDKALYGLLFAKVYLNEKIPIQQVDAVDFSIDYYTINKNNYSLAYCYLYKSACYTHLHKSSEGIQVALKALELAKTEKDGILLGDIYANLGFLYAMRGQYEKGIEYHKIAISYFEKGEDTLKLSKAHLNTSRIYTANEQFEEAILSSTKALEITTDSIVIGDLLCDIGNGYFFNDNIDSALVFLYRSLEYPYEARGIGLRYYNISNVYSYMEEFDSASVYVDKVLELPMTIYILEECYRILTRIALSKDDKESLREYIRLRNNCQDSIRKLETNPTVNLIEQMHESNKISERAQQQRSFLIELIIALLVICGLVFYYFYNKHKKKQAEAENYKTELEEKNTLLDIKDEELEKKRDLLLQEFSEELQRTKEKYAEKRKKATFEHRSEIDRDIFKEALHIDNEEIFTTKMNHLLNNLPDKLKKDYPEITYKEIIWCCLFMLDFSTNDIALILRYKQSSQYKFKQRLSKKLGFNSSKELENMLLKKLNL